MPKVSDRDSAPGERIPGWLYAAIFVAALLLRLYGIALQNLWYDEHWTLRVAAAPIAQLPDLLLTHESSKPPIYFALVHYWLKLGTGEAWLRWPSVIAGALGSAVAAAIGRQLFGGRVGVLLGLLVVLSPFHIYYSQEARPYALWGLFVGAAFLCHLKFCAGPQLKWLLGYVCFAVLASYTFTYAFFIVGFSILFTLSYRPALSREILWQTVAANGLIVLLYLPWLAQVLGSISDGVGFQGTHRAPVYQAAAYSFFSLGLGTSFGPSMDSLRLFGSRVFREDPGQAAMLVFGGLLVAGLVSSGLWRLWRMNRNAFYFSFFGILVFWGTPALLNLVIPDVPYNPRYAFPAVVPVLVPILEVFCGVFSKGGWRWGWAAAFGCSVALSLGNHFFNPAHARDDLRAAAHFLRELQPQPQQVIVCADHLSDIFGYYLQVKIPLQPLKIPADTPAQESLETVWASLSNIRRFALVYSRTDHGDPERRLPGLLEARYRLIEKRRWTGVDVYVFDVPVAPSGALAGTFNRRSRKIYSRQHNQW